MKYLKIFCDFVEDLKELSDPECGRLFRAMLEYASTGEVPDLKGNERFIWCTAKKQIDNQRESYENICQTNKRIATERYGALRSVTERNEACQDKDKEKDKDKDEEKNKRFIAPTREEVRDFAKSRGNKVDADKFFDYFEAGNWKDAKGNQVRNWKQKMITWEKHTDERDNKQPVKQHAERSISYD